MTAAFPAHRIIRGDSMVARVRLQGTLAVIFSRDGEEPETRIVADGRQAWASAVGLIAKCDELRAGDQLTVQHYDGTGD
jgi:hypothetical protein